MKNARSAALLLSIRAVAGIGKSADKTATASIDEAIRFVAKPADGIFNMSPFELQVHYRLMCLLHEAGYKYDEKDAPSWKAYMLDEKQNMYARLCAAYFLLDRHEEARAFVTAQLASTNLRYRYNAAEIVDLHVGRDTKKKWGVDVLIKVVADGSIDGSGVRSSPRGEYPAGDRDDIPSEVTSSRPS